MGRPPKEKPNHGELFEVKITIGKNRNGGYIRKSFYSSISKEDARKKAEEWKIERLAGERAGLPHIEKDPLFSEWADQWLEVYVKGKVKDSTYFNNYELPLRGHLKPRFGNQHLSEIRPIDIQRLLDSKIKKLSVESVKKIRVCLRQIFDVAIENHLCALNPVTPSVKIKPRQAAAEGFDKKVKRFYTAEQRELITEFAKRHPHGLPVLVMLYTGVSRSELLGLQWDDVTPDYTIHIRRGVTDVKNAETNKWEVVVDDSLKNSYRRRDIPIPVWLYDIITTQPRTVRLGGSIRNKTPLREIPADFIFHASTGGAQSPQNFSNWVYKRFMHDMVEHFKENKIDMPALSPHELRHTAATLWGLAGVNPYMIAKLCGWSDLEMVSKIYGHADTKSLRAALGY